MTPYREAAKKIKDDDDWIRALDLISKPREALEVVIEHAFVFNKAYYDHLAMALRDMARRVIKD